MANLKPGDLIQSILETVINQANSTNQNSGANQTNGTNPANATNQVNGTTQMNGTNQVSGTTQMNGTSQINATSQINGTNPANATSQANGTNQNGGFNFGDLTELAKVIKDTKILDAEKLTALKTGLLTLATSGNLPGTVRLKLAPLIAILQTVPSTGTDPNANKNISKESLQNTWNLLQPFLNDPQKLSAMLSLFGQYGGKLLEILKVVFLRT